MVVVVVVVVVVVAAAAVVYGGMWCRTYPLAQTHNTLALLLTLTLHPPPPLGAAGAWRLVGPSALGPCCHRDRTAVPLPHRCG